MVVVGSSLDDSTSPFRLTDSRTHARAVEGTTTLDFGPSPVRVRPSGDPLERTASWCDGSAASAPLRSVVRSAVRLLRVRRADRPNLVERSEREAGGQEEEIEKAYDERPGTGRDRASGGGEGTSTAERRDAKADTDGRGRSSKRTE